MVALARLVAKVVGDWGAHDGYNGKFDRDQASVAEAMSVYAEKTPVSFIVSTGDINYPKGVARKGAVKIKHQVGNCLDFVKTPSHVRRTPNGCVTHRACR